MLLSVSKTCFSAHRYPFAIFCLLHLSAAYNIPFFAAGIPGSFLCCSPYPSAVSMHSFRPPGYWEVSFVSPFTLPQYPCTLFGRQDARKLPLSLPLPFRSIHAFFSATGILRSFLCRSLHPSAVSMYSFRPPGYRSAFSPSTLPLHVLRLFRNHRDIRDFP